MARAEGADLPLGAQALGVPLEALVSSEGLVASDALSGPDSADCACPPPALSGYLMAALVGALSLAILVGSLMMGRNLGRPDAEPVFRPGGSPTLLVAQAPETATRAHEVGW